MRSDEATSAGPVEPAAGGWRRPSAWAVVVVVAYAVQPFASFADTNRSQLRGGAEVWQWAAFTALFCLALLPVLTRRGGEAAAASSIAIGVTAFFSYDLVFEANPETTAQLALGLVVWTVLAGLAIRLARALSSSPGFRTGLALFGVMLAFIPIVGYTTYALDDGQSAAATPAEDPAVDPPVETPNVYFFVLDAYARHDQLLQHVGLDDQPFLDDLEDSGFQVSGSSRSSYARTHLSVSSTLEMDYPVLPGDSITDSFGAFTPVVLGDNATVRRFRSFGYTYAYSEAGPSTWALCSDDLADVCLPTIHPGLAVGELGQALIDLTPVGAAITAPVPYTTPVHVVDQVQERLVGEDREPFFLFAHVLSPHWPYRFREDCSARPAPLYHLGLSTERSREEYEHQVRCLDPLVLDAVDDIVASDPTAVIILQSDHGSDFTLDWFTPPSEWSTETLEERYSVLNAVRLPQGCDADIDGQPLVNTFRIVFACLEGEDPELLDHRAFLSPWEQLDSLEEIEPARFGDAPPSSATR